MMHIRKSEVGVLAIVLLSFLIGLYLYPQVPARMASHWNAQGQVDGYMPRVWGLFLMPFILSGLALLFVAIPRIDPLRANIEKFRKYYDVFIILFSIFMLVIYLQTILWNLGTRISPNEVFPAGLGLIFFYTGVLLGHAKRNWFIGIRTPWTLSSDRVWEKTHRIGSRLFKIAGVLAFVGIFFERYAVFFVLIPVISVAAYTTIYSYFEYQKEMR